MVIMRKVVIIYIKLNQTFDFVSGLINPTFKLNKKDDIEIVILRCP